MKKFNGLKIAKQMTGGGLPAMRRLLALSAILCALLFFSCDNMSGGGSDYAQQTAVDSTSAPTSAPTGSHKTVIISGSLSSGAVPAAIANSVYSSAAKDADSEQTLIARSATPTIDEEGYYCYVKTLCQETGVEKEYTQNDTDSIFTESSSSITFELPLLTDYTWVIECGIKKTGLADPVLFDKTNPIHLDDTDSVVNVSFAAKPNPSGNGGVGTVNLDLFGTFRYASVTCSDDDWVAAAGDQTKELTVAYDEVTSSGSTTLSLSSVKAKAYEVAFSFYNADMVMVYQSVQNVSVLAGMETKSWISDSGDEAAVINSDHMFQVESAATQAFDRKTIYVGKVVEGTTASNSNAGSAYAPLATVDAAINAIKARGSNDQDYIIFVSGEVEHAGEISTVSTSSKARSLTFQGVKGSSSDIIKGSGSGTVVAVAGSSAPVFFRNICIKGGDIGVEFYGATKAYLENGALVTGCKQGLNCHSGSKVTMNGGSISGNKGVNQGAGVYINGSDAKFYLKGGIISENEAANCGGGIYAAYSNVEISGGEISQNKAPIGAGLYCGSDTVMTGGKITQNTATQYGGGVYILNNQKFTITGGEISQNEAAATVVDTDSKEQPGGGAIANFKSGTLIIGDAAYIPYGDKNGNKGAGKNDIGLVSNSTSYPIVNVDSLLSRHNSSNPVRVSLHWAVGAKFYATNSDSLTKSVADAKSVRLVDEDWEYKYSADKKTVLIDSPFYVGSYNGVMGVDTNSGSKTSPFKTIAKACQMMDNAEVDYTIKIIGTTSAIEQEIPATLLNTGSGESGKNYAHSVTISGSGDNATINRGLSGNSSYYTIGSALTINSAVPVTIANVKITGGRKNGNGGGLYMATGSTVTLDDGTAIDGNVASTSGGAVYDAGTLKLNGSVSIPDKDVFVASGKTVEIGSNFSLKDSTKKINLTPEGFKKNLKVLTGATDSNIVSFASNAKGFAFKNDSGYGVLALKNIIKDIYVSQSGSVDPEGNAKDDSTWNNSTYAYNDNEADITEDTTDELTSNKTKPFKTIAKALQFITYQESADTEYTIHVTGTMLTAGPNEITKDNSSSNNPIKIVKTATASQPATAKKITIIGESELNSGSPQDVVCINTNSRTSVFIITTDVPVIFQKLAIKNGTATMNDDLTGGGIRIASGADVTLGEYAFVINNSALCGGGIYNEGILTVKANSKIYGNSISTVNIMDDMGGGGIYNKGANAKVYIEGGEIYKNSATSGNKSGGGVYNNGGSVFIYGNAAFGSSDNANSAYSGGAIYNKGYLYLGYKSANSGAGKTPVNDTDVTWSGKIQYNLAALGAGIYNATSSYVYMKNGTIRYNVNQSGDNVENNHGLGVWTDGTFVIYDGSIKNHTNTSKNARGAGVFIGKNGTFDMLGGKISDNKIKKTDTGYGGAVYSKGVFKMSGSASIEYGIKMDLGISTVAGQNDVVLAPKDDTSGDGQATTRQACITVGNLTSTTKAIVRFPTSKRGIVFLAAKTSGTGAITDITDYVSKFELGDSNYSAAINPGKTQAATNAQIWVAASGSSTNSGVNYNYPVDSFATAESIITEANCSFLSYEIKIYSDLTKQTLTNSLNGMAAGIDISPYYSGAKITGSTGSGANAVALNIGTSVPVTIKGLKITGATNTASDISASAGTPLGGGIYINTGANVTLSGGVLVTGNNVKLGSGGGIYNKGTLTLAGLRSDYKCVIKDNHALTETGQGNKSGGGIYNSNYGTLIIGDYVEISDNDAAGKGGAIYNAGTLKMQGNFTIPGGTNNANDVYLGSNNNQAINIIDAITGDAPVASITSASTTDGTVVIKKGANVSMTDANFKSYVQKFAMANLMQTLKNDGTFVNHGEATKDNVVDMINAVSANGQTIVLTGEGNTYPKDDFNTAMNNLSYKINLDVSELSGHCSLGGFEFSTVKEFALNARITDAGIRTANKPNMEKLYIKGSATLESGSMKGYTGLVNGACCEGDDSLRDIYYVNATTATIYYGFSRSPSASEENPVNIHIPTTVTKLIFQNTDGLKVNQIKLVYEGTVSQLKNKLSSSKIELNIPERAASYTFYCSDGGTATWSKNAGSGSGSWQ